MRVEEKDCDRKAEVRLHRHARIEPLDEYSEYIDSQDKAVCCYIPVSSGDQIKLAVAFWGTVSGRVYS